MTGKNKIKNTNNGHSWYVAGPRAKCMYFPRKYARMGVVFMGSWMP